MLGAAATHQIDLLQLANHDGVQVRKLRLGVRHIDGRGRGRLEELVLALGRAGGRLGLQLGAAIKQLLHKVCEQ